MTELVVIADDFTGACDTAAQFAGPDLPCSVILPAGSGVSASPGAVRVYDTESRHLAPSQAHARIESLSRGLPGDVLLYKKVDSTLRGNITAELSALAARFPDRTFVVCPAFPAAGRTVVDGRLLVNGAPLSGTAFANDPRGGVRESGVAAVLPPELDAVHLPVRELATALTRSSARAFVLDAGTDEELESIARAAAGFARSIVFVGSAGLASALPRAATGASTSSFRDDERGPALRPVLAVVGSLNPVSQAQADRVVEDGTRCFTVSPDSPDCVPAITQALSTTGRAVLMSDRLSRAADADEIAGTLGAVTARVLGTVERLSLILTGGDTAVAVANALSVTQVEVVGEYLPGIPHVVIGAGGRTIPAATKAGGFGEPDAMSRLMTRLATED